MIIWYTFGDDEKKPQPYAPFEREARAKTDMLLAVFNLAKEALINPRLIVVYDVKE